MVEVELKFQLPESKKKNCPAILKKTQSKEHPLTGKVLRYT